MLFRTISLLAAVVLLAGCDAVGLPGGAGAPADAAAVHVIHTEGFVEIPDASPLRQSLKVEAAAQRQVATPISAPGVIEARPERLVKIAPPVAGRITKVHRALGDAVKAGDVLFTLDSAELSAAYGEVASSQAALSQARQELERQKLLFEADVVAKKDYEAAQLEFKQAETEARVSGARLAQLGAASAKPGRDYLLRSPIAGRVIEMNGAEGGYWNDINEPLMTVADLSTVFLAGSVAEKDIAGVFAGQKARIVLNAYADQAVEGTVKYVGEVLDPETRTVKVRVAIDNPEGRFRPGMFANVVFDGAERAAVVVPASAVVQSGLYSRVFVETAPFRYEPRVVTLGGTTGSAEAARVEVVSGLKAGERVVVRNGVLLDD